VPKALKIMRGVVSGLAAANGAGVVHRDLKPANIMVEAETDEPQIMDFGIARSTAAPDKDQQAAGAGQAQLAGMAGAPAGKTPSALTQATTVGAIVGTVSYMSPEQVRAEDVDQRADLYALGLIFYDMLVGPKRFEGLNPIEELQRRLMEPPASPRSVDDTIPEALDRIIMRCLAPDRNERYETTADLEAELNRLDDNGVPLPVYRRLTWRTMTAAATLTLSLMGATYWITRPPPPRPETPPMSVLVTDFDNRTNDPVFTGTVEKALGLGLEGASFITAYSREEASRLAAQMRPGSRLDESIARLISAREGIKVILAGRIEPKGSGYSLAVRAIDPAVDKVLAETTATANSKENVLPTVAKVAADLRGRLGDTTPESARLAASETVTASSLEALQAYTRAQELADANRNQEALAAYQDTVRLDPNFGRAYAGMGVLYAIAKDEVKAKAAYDEALKRVDRMSEREKLRTLGTYYMMVARNYEKAIENYETLVKLYPADDGGHGNLGLAYLYTGNIERARAEAQAVLKIYPSQWAQRYNYAMYSMYAGDFATAEKEGLRVLKEAPTFELGAVPVALSMLIQGDFSGALSTYDRLAQMSPAGASLARYGRADLEMYRGRQREALKILQAAIPADIKDDNTGSLAQNYLALSQAWLATGQMPKATEAARKAVGLSNHESVLLPAALVLIETGQKDEAERIAAMLENMLQTHTTAYSRLIDAQLAVSRGRYAQAVELFRDSIKRRDTWFARLLLGRLYAETEHYPEAMAELDLCIKRRGEVLDVFFYDTPTARYLPPAYYWLARAQQALGSGDAKKNYEAFLATRAASDPPDPLAEDARRRLK
jgi:tetratricopeptide (TPR) repeat protein